MTNPCRSQPNKTLYLKLALFVSGIFAGNVVSLDHFTTIKALVQFEYIIFPSVLSVIKSKRFTLMSFQNLGPIRLQRPALSIRFEANLQHEISQNFLEPSWS